MFFKHIAGWVLLCSICGSVYAEGSYQTGLWTNQRLIDFQASGYPLMVDILTTGEVINVSLCGRADDDDVSVEILDPDGNSVYTSGIMTQGNVSCSDPFTAPLTTPIRYTTSKTGAYTVRLENLMGVNGADTDISRFDITVTANNSIDPDPSASGGRVWATGWQFQTYFFTEAVATDADYYALVPGGRYNTNYVWKLDLNNFSGNFYTLLANDLGVDAPYSGYSIPSASGSVSAKFPQYLSYPAIANPRPEEPPVLFEGFSFTDNAGQDYAISPAATAGFQDSGNFQFRSDVAGTYAITIDTNQDGVFGAGDRLLLGNMVSGANSVPWDGTDANGAVLANGEYRANLELRLGEYHFIADDAETSGGTQDGLTIFLANSDGSTVDTRVYWDDATYLTGTSILPDGEMASTSAGKHTWGDFTSGGIGNNTYIDTYVYGLASTYTTITAIVTDDTLQTGTDGTVTAPVTAAAGSNITISVNEPDANILSGVVETISVAVDNATIWEREQLTLTETGVNTGIFTAVLTTSNTSGAGISNDGSMNVQVGHQVVTTYEDQLTSSGTAASVYATTTIVDVTPPVITLLGSDPVSVEQGMSYTDAGATASDDNDGNLTGNIVTVNPVNTSVVGAYTVTYNVSDAAGNAATQVTRTVNVTADVTPPVITLLGSNLVSVEQGTGYTDAGATAADSFDGNLTGSIVTVNPVNTSVVGAYSVTYNVSDAAGNVATQVTRTVNVTADATPPVITRLGSDPVNVEQGTGYTDAGATAADSFDGNLTGSIVTVNPVNTSVVGAYSVTYNVSDAAGNAATQVTRTVNVTADATPPVITRLGSDPVDVEQGTGYTDAGATAADSFDGDLSASIVTDNPVNTSVVGAYTVTYNVTDAAGNAATQVTRVVNVTADATPPVISLLGSNPVSVEQGTGYTDAGATAADSFDGNITGSIVTVNPVNTSVVGAYSVTYNVTDAAGNAATQVTRVVNVTADATPPVISLLGSNPVSVEQGTGYTDAGATAADSFDGNITGSIVTVNPVNTSVVGAYSVTYNVTDAAGNAATQVTRTVNVTADATPPVITLLGSNPVNVEQGTGYTDAGATAADSFDGDLTGSIVTVNSVNTSVLGAYTVTYNVTDAAGNAATQVTRTVNVTADATPPVISLLGSNPVDVPLGSSYSDAGATASDDIDGDITANIVTVNPVNTSLVGSYTVTYNVSDATGNAATQVTRSVNVTFDPLPDDDGDGIVNGDEGTGDFDGDGVLDFLDLDSDNDAIPDTIEGSVDSDSDGIPDYLDLDSDNDGLYDLVESGADYAALDTLHDGTIDITNSVGANGLADAVETTVDSATLSYNNGSPLDSDADGVEDYVDLDSDNDALTDVYEAGGVDPDGDGIVGTGLPTVDTYGVATAGAALAPIDNDGDGVNDQIDLDSDNDGIMDVVEFGGEDADGDGQTGSAPAQVDSKGLSVDGSLPAIDSDGDGVPNQHDLDSDNDGIPDVTEAGGDDPDGDGIAGTGVAVVNELGVGSMLNPGDIDGDSILDPYDPDSDGDGIFDLVEAGGPDTDNDGQVDGFIDTNGDGFDDGITATALALPDTDGDGIPDYRDNDDTDNDGVPDSVDIDDDNDGIPDVLEGDGNIDTDGDGVPDSRDLDSDNDGLYDLSEAGFQNPSASDADNDGRLDSTLSVGANGFADRLETTVDSGLINYNGGTLLDTDADGVKDFRDLDSDNDSIPDVIEAGGDDADGDGVLGTGSPSVNSNGVKTGAGQGPVDTDGDGTPDQQDLDSDNDGKTDLQEAGGPDSDANGMVDSFIDTNGDGFDDTRASSPAVLPDTDRNGTPDYLDAGTETAVVGAGLNGMGAFNLWILAVFGLLAGLRLLRGVLVSALSVLMLLAVQGEAVAQQKLEAESEQQHFYIGAGIGRSTMQPTTSGTSYSLIDDSDSATRLYIGADLSSSWSVELSLSDLGSATFQPSGNIDYKVTAVNALYYLYNEGENDHIGMGLYLKAGLGKMDVTADIPYEVYNATSVSLGGGLEYAWENGFAVRADLESFDEDASLVTLGLLYRFGKQDKPAAKDSDQDGILDSSDECPQTPLQATVDSVGCQLDSDKDGVFDDEDKCPGTAQGVSVGTDGCTLDTDRDGIIDDLDKCPETAQGASVDSDGCTLDTDKDGVLDDLDLCPDTSIGTKVDKHGCPFFNAPIAGVNFELARGDLTKSAKVELDKAAKVLLEYPSVRIEIQAHTDSQGEIENNQKLSDIRARSVREYLLSKGIAADRMTAVGYGELKPIVSNKLPEGRAINRRVEFKVLQ